MNVDEIEAGRELDALIARWIMKSHVFNWHDVFIVASDEATFEKAQQDDGTLSCFVCSDGSYCHNLPHYSTLIEPAWRVYEKLEEKGIIRVSNGDGDSKDCDFIPFLPGIPKGANTSAETYPLAICITALKAYGIMDEPILFSHGRIVW